jgi:2-polyprenyl-3-methyl-5-hydroxy-6-metoxy-1,4-benzoquinol methylase
MNLSVSEELKKDTKSYWIELHREGIRNNDQLSPVCYPDESGMLNRLYDFGHRMGMREVFKRLGDLKGKRVLDIGCGRGRWSKEFAGRGAEVLGVDWSREAINRNRQEAAECAFECMSVKELNHFEPASFDIVNSVTVIQHVRRDFHQKIFEDIHKLLATDGTFCMIESIYNPFLSNKYDHADGDYTFCWSKKAWIDLAEKCGFRLTSLKGCLYMPLLRIYHKLPVVKKRDIASPLTQKTHHVLKELLTLCSFPIEALSSSMPHKFATHGIFIFEKKE